MLVRYGTEQRENISLRYSVSDCLGKKLITIIKSQTTNTAIYLSGYTYSHQACVVLSFFLAASSHYPSSNCTQMTISVLYQVYTTHAPLTNTQSYCYLLQYVDVFVFETDYDVSKHLGNLPTNHYGVTCMGTWSAETDQLMSCSCRFGRQETHPCEISKGILIRLVYKTPMPRPPRSVGARNCLKNAPWHWAANSLPTNHK